VTSVLLDISLLSEERSSVPDTGGGRSSPRREILFLADKSVANINCLSACVSERY
jgi:hypothetical protein